MERYFYPRPPRGGRPLLVGIPPTVRIISIHALREEGDKHHPAGYPSGSDFYPRPPRGGRQLRKSSRSGWKKFLSTPSARRATYALQFLVVRVDISIHALREEGDFLTIDFLSFRFDFYPRPPRGGRLDDFSAGQNRLKFLSTPSARRATLHRVARFQAHEISIHALREEGDAGGGVKIQDPKTFLSTPSARRATNIGRHPF